MFLINITFQYRLSSASVIARRSVYMHVYTHVCGWVWMCGCVGVWMYTLTPIHTLTHPVLLAQRRVLLLQLLDLDTNVALRDRAARGTRRVRAGERALGQHAADEHEGRVPRPARLEKGASFPPSLPLPLSSLSLSPCSLSLSLSLTRTHLEHQRLHGGIALWRLVDAVPLRYPLAARHGSRHDGLALPCRQIHRV